jgi:hypothetical protein
VTVHLLSHSSSEQRFASLKPQVALPFKGSFSKEINSQQINEGIKGKIIIIDMQIKIYKKRENNTINSNEYQKNKYQIQMVNLRTVVTKIICTKQIIQCLSLNIMAKATGPLTCHSDFAPSIFFPA